VEGEPPDLIPFLGTSRLAEPVDRFNASLVFHGHAHYGSPRGETARGVPVFNVALPLLQRVQPEHPFVVVEI
jgi:Icc-related predicted phosphoesterase